MEDKAKDINKNAGVTVKSILEIIEYLDRPEFERLQSVEPEALSELASHLDVLILAKLRLFAAVSQWILSLPSDERQKIVSELIERIDGREIARALESIITAIRITLEENPQVEEALSAKATDFLNTLDFGKARVGVTTAGDALFSIGERVVEQISKNPVAIANLVGFIPPVINGLLRVAARFAESLSLPEEVFASAIFNTISAIDTAVFANLVNSIAARINELHTGNIVLGWDEREFKKVSYDFLSGLVENLDVELLASSIIALGEDVSDLLDSFIKVCVTDPAAVSALVGALIEISAIAIKVYSLALEEFLALPETFFEEALSRARKAYDPAQIARLANSFSSMAKRFHDADPGFYAEFAGKFIDDLDLESALSAVAAVFSSYLNAFSERISRDELLSPDKTGEIANRAMRRYNSAFSKKEMDGGEYLARFVANLDKDELIRTSENVCFAVLKAYESDPEKVAGVLKPYIITAFKILWRTLTGRLRKIFKLNQ